MKNGDNVLLKKKVIKRYVKLLKTLKSVQIDK